MLFILAEMCYFCALPRARIYEHVVFFLAEMCYFCACVGCIGFVRWKPPVRCWSRDAAKEWSAGTRWDPHAASVWNDVDHRGGAAHAAQEWGVETHWFAFGTAVLRRNETQEPTSKKTTQIDSH